MLSEDTRTRILAEASRYPKRRTALLPALKLAQEEVGWLPPEAVAEVASLVGVSSAAANELLTFYTMLRDRPGGTAHVEVCVQLPCAIAGGETLLRKLSEALGIAPGETTPDGRVTLVRTPECFGSCHRPPMCRVDDEYWENLDDERIELLLAALAAVRPRSATEAA